ncbi:hypothetical protein AC578_10349 [Pseudocercospora eumusae]|uniref:F-box domain-containing protein n=1 Tax=Pseudocercospora eumusae TaxID=321146 RepID=A0A139HRN1_9PEZI|nr:hypothetical protein AC578_10349 [Pseudocercospora eumusae]
MADGRFETHDQMSKSSFLALPPEIRMTIFEHCLHIPRLSTTSVPHRAAAYAKGYTSGVGHITLVQDGGDWRSVSIARPPGFAFTATSVLRICKSIHKEAMDVLYDKILWVINIQNRRPIAPPFIGSNSNPAISASPTRPSVFMKWVAHVHIRQHIRPEEELLQKAEALRLLIACLGSDRKSTAATLHFDSIHLVNDSEWPRTAKPQYAWDQYYSQLMVLDLGPRPNIRTSYYWIETEGQERFEDLTRRLGGCLNDPDYIYW